MLVSGRAKKGSILCKNLSLDSVLVQANQFRNIVKSISDKTSVSGEVITSVDKEIEEFSIRLKEYYNDLSKTGN